MRKNKFIPLLVATMILGSTVSAHAATEVAITNGTGSGSTPTSFTVTSDMLGGDLVVTVPDSMVLSYDGTNSKFADTDVVSAKGNISPAKQLEVTLPSNSITYLHQDDNSVDAVGTLTWGTDLKETWTASQLRASLTTLDSRNISSEVPVSEVEYIGTYEATMTFTISLVDTP